MNSTMIKTEYTELVYDKIEFHFEKNTLNLPSFSSNYWTPLWEMTTGLNNHRPYEVMIGKEKALQWSFKRYL